VRLGKVGLIEIARGLVGGRGGLLVESIFFCLFLF